MINAPTLGEVESLNVERLTGLSCPANPLIRDPFHQRLCRAWGDGNRALWAEGTCKVCACEIPKESHPLDMGFATLTVPVTVCDDCMPLVREHYSPSKRGGPVALTPRWEEDCPLRLRELIESGNWPAHFDQVAYKRVLEWSPGESKGLAITGESGLGKTTSLWALFRKIEREGGNPKFLSGVELSRVLSRSARDLDSIEWLWKTRVLLIDDFGKEKVTPGATALLWELIDRRYQNKLPVILTTRYTGSEIRDRLGEPQLGGDIVRRLNDICRPVRFGKSPTPPNNAND